MPILSYQTIMKIKPIVDPQQRTEVVLDGVRFTHGCGPAGYDLRLDEVLEYRILNHGKGPGWYLPPGAFVLASAVEKFNMPADILGVVHDKSSWARRGLTMQNTVIEPGWRGYLTLEMTNHSEYRIWLPQGVGICQVIFHELDKATKYPYDGKYQDQEKGPQKAR